MDGVTTYLALAIFALTYLIIASQKIPLLFIRNFIRFRSYESQREKTA